MRQHAHAQHQAKSAKRLQRWLTQAASRLAGEPCLLCQQPSTVCGVFLPTDSQRYGAVAGKQRFLAYSLCATCYAQPGKSPAIEAALAQLVRSQQAALN